MKILLYAYGTRGDIQPYLALAYALNQAGHDCTLAAPALHAGFCAEYGVRLFPRIDEPIRWLERPDVRELMQNEAARVAGTMTAAQLKGHKALAKRYSAEIGPRLEALAGAMLDEQLQAARQERPDLIVHTFAGQDYAHFVAEEAGIPRIVAELYPHYHPSYHYPAAQFHDRNLPRVVNRLTHLLPRLFVPMRGTVKRFRRDALGLPPRRGMFDRLHEPSGKRVPLLHMFSRHLLPSAPDWPPSVHSMGFSFLPARPGFRPAAELSAFLDAGTPPVVVGFGSLGNPHPVETGRTVRDAVRAAGVRAVVVRGSGLGIQVTDAPDTILVVDDVPFAWLLPRTAGVVHGGGIGVTHDVLRAGVPSLPCPLFREPMMWADRAHRTGAALTPVWQANLTTDTLAEGLRRLTRDEGLRAAAGEMARKVEQEPGHRLAAEVVENTARRHARR